MKFINLLIPILLAVCCWNCGSKDLQIDISKFEGNTSLALKANLEVVNNKIRQKNNSDNFNGQIRLTKESLILQEIKITNGELESMKVFDIKGRINGTYTKVADGFSFKNTMDSLKTECIWKSFNNQSLINGTIEEEDHTCTIKMKSAKGNINAVMNVIKNGKLIISEITGRFDDTKKVIFKTINYKRKFNDTLSAIVTFSEDMQKKYELNNDYATLYSEEVKILNGEEEARLSTSFSYKGDLHIYTSLDNFNGKNCSESDALFYSNTFIFGNHKYELSNCAFDGLEIINKTLNKNISGKTIKERFFNKRKNNLYFTKEKSDIDFYFSE
jgi:hypothetical protein